MDDSIHAIQKRLAACFKTPFSKETLELQPSRYDKALLDKLKAQSRFPAVYQLRTYNEQYWFRLITCMQKQFPLLRHLMGLEDFNRLVMEFLTAHPSKNPDLNLLGEGLADFLVATDLEEDKKGLYTETASLESIYNKVFVSSTQNPIAIETLTSKLDEIHQKKFIFQPHVHGLAQRHLLYPFLNKARNDLDNKLSFKIKQKENTFFIFQLKNEVQFCSATRDEIFLFEALQKGYLLDAAMEHLLQREASVDPAEMLREWMQKATSFGWLVDLE